MSGIVYVVGAGPGDPELLTLKAARVIREADAIVYDRLINAEVLRLARPGAELIYVGKEDGMHAVPQEEINAMLARLAQKHARVVRLKGGDPHVFGRGGEEELHLAANRVRFEVIPGISSAVAAATYAGIPVTHRGIAASFAVITGHRASGELDDVDWAGAARIDTLVFLMGVRNRSRIAAQLIANGRPPEEPVAFVEEGTTAAQRVVTSTLGEVRDPAVDLEVRSPAVMIVGKVVSLRKDLAWFDPATRQESAPVGALVAALLRQNPKAVVAPLKFRAEANG